MFQLYVGAIVLKKALLNFLDNYSKLGNMKIVNRKEFLALPENTLFAKCGDHDIGELHIKGETMGNDFVSASFKGYEYEEASDFCSKFDKMVEEKIQLPFAPYDDACRDGLFDEDQLFMIYDKEDIKKIIEMLQQCI